jgi:hypothetical protein
MKTIFRLMVSTAMAVALAFQLSAQDSGPPPEAGVYRSTTELDQLVGPIALYPDPLIAQILPAATQPADIVVADRYLQGGGDPNQVDSQPWDPSVKALAHYPELIKWMDDNLTWTTQLGQAFVTQQADVMNAVQQMRAQAQSLGNLTSTPQQQVVVAGGVIEVLPVNPEVIYVPVYEPAYVYYRRPVFDSPWITFGIGWSVGFWFDHDCDWHHHDVIVWGHDHPRPHDWWTRRPDERFHSVTVHDNLVVRNRTVINENVSVWRPQPHAGFTDANRAARGYDVHPSRVAPARPIEHPVAPRPFQQPAPTRTDPATRRVEPAPVRTEPAPRRTEPAPGRIERPAERPQAIERPAPTVERPAVVQRPSPPPVQRVAPPVQHYAPPVQRPAAPVYPANGALIGVHSTRETQQYTTRGQQSRGTANPPAPQHNSGSDRKR